MRKFKYMIAAAIVSQSFAFAATPALAEATITGSIPTQTQLNAVCTSLIAFHAAPAGFTSVAVNSIEVVDSTDVTESEHIVTGGGEPELGGVALTGPYVNFGATRGNNHNIFGVNAYTTQTFPSSLETWTETTVVTKHAAFHCDVFNKAGKKPSDWQIYNGNSDTWTETTVEDKSIEVAGYTEDLATPVPTDDGATLVCNKPRTTWVTKAASSFGACSDELFAEALANSEATGFYLSDD